MESDVRLGQAATARVGGRPLLAVQGLSVSVSIGGSRYPVLRDVNFTVDRGEVVCIVGESGCGKSMTALSLFGLLPEGARSKAKSMCLDELELSGLRPEALRSLRGNQFAMIFQDPNTAFNPSLTIGEQMVQVWRYHRQGSRQDALRRACALLERVGIGSSAQRMHQYPHQLSGGQRQRAMIAMALMCSPKLLVADEPTTALDVTVQAQVLRLFKEIQAELGLGLLMITHDFGVVSAIADRVIVMYAGEVVEAGPTRTVLDTPKHPYTRALLACLPRTDCLPRADEDQGRATHLPSIPGAVPALTESISGCRFAPRCNHVTPACRAPMVGLNRIASDYEVRCIRWNEALDVIPIGQAVTVDSGSVVGLPAPVRPAVPLLQMDNVSRNYRISQGLFQRAATLQALRGVSLTTHSRETLAIVGESGCGKTTLASVILGLLAPSAGAVRLQGSDIQGLTRRDYARQVQPVFQDPYASLPPHRRVIDAVMRPMHDLKLHTRQQRREMATVMLERVGLSTHFHHRLPSELSGGQRQRVAIARALVLGAPILICDEPTSALDVSVQAQILNLLGDLREERDLSLVLITHNLSVVAHLADRVVVMYLGQVVEQGPARRLMRTPRHPYTRLLLGSILRVDAAGGGLPAATESAAFNPLLPPSGCAFHPRCDRAQEQCRVEAPELRREGTCTFACHLPLEESDVANDCAAVQRIDGSTALKNDFPIRAELRRAHSASESLYVGPL